MAKVDIVEFEDPRRLGDVRRLFRAYAAGLDIDLGFQGFEDELAGLPGRYAPARRGCLLLALERGEAVGCVGLRDLGGGICEMKRLYAVPAARGLGLGRALAEAVIERARRLGYAKMRLDTMATMLAARGLYESLGFRTVEPYTHNPLEGARFFELALDAT